jgi:hypothetical protein
MLREDNKPVRVRVCGDLARYIDDEELEALAGGTAPTQVPAISVVDNLHTLDVASFEPELEAA